MNCCTNFISVVLLLFTFLGGGEPLLATLPSHPDPVPQITPSTVDPPSDSLSNNPRIPAEAIPLSGLEYDKAEKLELWRTTHRCGINSLYSYLKLHDIDVSYESLMRTVPMREQGATIADLAQVAVDHGCESVVVKATPETLSRLLPAIVHCEEELVTTGHYNVVIDVTTEQVCFIDGTSGVFKCVSAVDFYDVWTGYTLAPVKSVFNQTSPVFFSATETTFMMIGSLVAGGVLISFYLRSRYH